MSTATAAIPLQAVPTIEVTQEAFADILAAKAAALQGKASEVLVNLGNSTLAAADKMSVGGPARWLAGLAKWAMDKFGWIIGRPVSWIGSRTSAGLLLTSETGQTLIKFAGRTLRWPFVASYRLLFHVIPRTAMLRFGEKGEARYAAWTLRLEGFENRVTSMLGLVSDITGATIGADRPWIQLVRRVFTVAAVRNLLWAFVPFAWVRYVVLAMTVFGQAVGAGLDTGLIGEDVEGIVANAAETITERSEQAKEQMQSTASSPTPADSPSPANMAAAGTTSKPSGRQGGPSAK